ncbi:MAG: hypothetical protein COV67_01735 [Nitrospinae bacterium CG11_big_fil_rev_8_21_14_0_20_56_8]|nr:MAG: hypothetical protein COV67_01735 [Nitrospinae bacterium CG11_big_fil_rev_8_21_14_0_20_56_8]
MVIFPNVSIAVGNRGEVPCFLRWVLLAMLVVGANGCGVAHVKVYEYLEEGKSFPRTVAILPFTVDESIPPEKRPNVIFRQVFYNYFRYLGYTDMPLGDVDRRLIHFNLGPEEIARLSPEELKTVLDVDAVVEGHVVDASNFTGGIHAETSIHARLNMVNLTTGKAMWEVDHTEMNYLGIAVPTVVTMIKGQMDNLEMGQAYYKVAETFAMKVVRDIPDPARFREERVALPMITRIETNLHPNRVLALGDEIEVSLHGEPGLAASFDIGSWKTGIPMREVSPGVYEVNYRIGKGDRIENALVIGTLKNGRGIAGKKFFKAALANVGADDPVAK